MKNTMPAEAYKQFNLRRLNIGSSIDGGIPLSLNPTNLLKHVITLGSSGSGKTYLTKVLIEEAVRLGLPVIAIDSQGDIASMALKAGPNLETHALATGFWSKVDFKIWTPGSEWGIPLSMQPMLDLSVYDRREDRVRAVHAMGLELAALAGSSSEADAAGMSKIIDYANRYDLALETVDDVCDFLKDPPQPLIDELTGIFDSKDRQRVLKSLLIKKNGPRQLLLEMGQPIHIDTLLGYEPGGAYDQGKVRISIISLKGMTSLEDQQIFIAALCRAMYAWMVKDPKDKPIAIMALDEVAPLAPPVRKPPSKEPLLMLLRQARKYGVGMFLATQSPGDIDLTGMGQIGTKFIGRITTPQEVAKLQPLFEYDVNDTLRILPEVKAGEFAVYCPDEFVNPMFMKSRRLSSVHKTLALEALDKLVNPADRVKYG